MKNMIFIVAGLLLISSFVTVGLGKEAGDKQTTINLTFSNLIIKNSDMEQYVELNFSGAQGVIYQSGAPILPMHSTKMTLPFGTKITSIECKTGEVKSMALNKKIIPAPNPVPLGITVATQSYNQIDKTIYNSDELFPSTWFNYYTGAGLDEDSNHKTFLVVQCYPVRYNSVENIINYVDSIGLTIKYQIPNTSPFPSTDSYQLVIIAPKKFSSALQPLITHKNNYGVKTILKTTEDIYSQYSGVDKPEQIKYFIKYAIETWGIKYVLLVGGLNSYIYGNPRENINYGAKDWLVPVRYTNLKETDSKLYDPGTISDLYYADIYNGTGAFSSWDSNHDGIFAKWDNRPGKDVIDFYPDVYVGRLPCENTQEVKIMVNKIINYEKGANGSSWANKIIVCGGDSFDDTGTNYREGEVASETLLTRYMSEYTPVKLYASYKDSNPSFVPTRTNIKREISKGAGFLFFDGHGNPADWITHYPGNFTSWIPHGGIVEDDFPSLSNSDKTPICVVEGCHNNQFNVSILYTFLDRNPYNKYHSWCYGNPVPECWSWWLTRKIGGGSIATFGNTGLGYGAVGEHGDLDGNGINDPDCVEALGGFWDQMFFKSIDEGAQYLGQAWGGAATKYLNVYPGMKDQADAKELEEYNFIGDPSLKIGGYPAGNGLRAEIIDSAAGVIGTPLEKMTFKADAFNTHGKVTYSWDLNEDGIYNDANGQTIAWNWKVPGVYKVSLKVQDESGATDIYNTIVGIEIGAKTPLKSVLAEQLQILSEKNPNIFTLLQQISGL